MTRISVAVLIVSKHKTIVSYCTYIIVFRHTIAGKDFKLNYIISVLSADIAQLSPHSEMVTESGVFKATNIM
jgi:hypothetical protein